MSTEENEQRRSGLKAESRQGRTKGKPGPAVSYWCTALTIWFVSLIVAYGRMSASCGPRHCEAAGDFEIIGLGLVTAVILAFAWLPGLAFAWFLIRKTRLSPTGSGILSAFAMLAIVVAILSAATFA